MNPGLSTNIILFMFGMMFSVITGGCQKKQEERIRITTVKELDLERYLGTWYEIARFDHSFERGLEGVTATYSFRPDGLIRVVNQGFKNSPNGEKSVAVGKAKTTSEPGKLKVSFFLFFYADYNILELDEEYQWVLIGSSSDRYLWILSRTPELQKDTLQIILEKAAQRGYETSKLIWVRHKTD